MEIIIGFIDLGAMGKPMASNLIKKGGSLRVYDLVEEKMKPLIFQRALSCGSSREVAAALSTKGVAPLIHG
ncbi:MAG: NAD(P)-binding domain-containing protein [Thermodesulfobacteriota bacterium]|nr:NAD(P)-binding domain-containing protein [Thermodesulfobacteriota bacterium]